MFNVMVLYGIMVFYFLGAFDPCVAHMDSMDVKHILYDTLG